MRRHWRTTRPLLALLGAVAAAGVAAVWPTALPAQDTALVAAILLAEETRDAAAAAIDAELDAFMHLWAINRGILLTPFHNMALMSPHHSMADIDRHSQVFRDAVVALTG